MRPAVGYFCYGIGINAVRPYKVSGINREPASDAKLACESHGARVYSVYESRQLSEIING